MPQGFLHDKLDVKVLILYILARIETPLDVDQIYEVAYQDDSLNYFVLAESVHELTDSGHLTVDDNGRYTITEKGRKHGSYVEDSMAVPVVEKVTVSIQDKINQLYRESLLSTEVAQDENGFWIATLIYRDDTQPLMRLSLLAPNQEHAKIMAANMRKNMSDVYKAAIDAATDEARIRRQRQHESD